jgi:diguanylate cyclase (GGDEF)-like protein
MELLLWRWSTAVQVTSAVMIAVFFAVLARSDPRAELRWWVRAWVVNLLALSVTILYWYLEPPAGVLPLVRGAYVAGKTAFLLLLLQGAAALVRPGAQLFTARQLALAAGVTGLVGAAVLDHVNKIGVGQAVIILTLLMMGAWRLFQSRDRGVRWLAVGMTIRAGLALVEAVAYASQLVSRSPAEFTGIARGFLSAHSSFDTGGEWLIALGCVLAVAERTQAALRTQNALLLAAQDDLRRLADRDPLTGLANRRTLHDTLQRVQPHGATLLFFDLDKFKTINDLHGHHAGDECLRRFGAALRDCFRPDDAVVRYAGDEFLVIAAGLDHTSIDERVEQVRGRLRRTMGHAPQFTFSVGVADLPPGGSAQEALAAADARMYQVKAQQTATA